MITTGLIVFAYYVLSFILSIFPTGPGLPTEFTDAITTIGGYLYILDPLVPLATLATVFGIVIAVDLIIFAWNGLRWAFSFIPFVGGRG